MRGCFTAMLVLISALALTSCIAATESTTIHDAVQVSIAPTVTSTPKATIALQPMTQSTPQPSTAHFAKPSFIPLQTNSSVKTSEIHETIVPPESYYKYKEWIPVDQGYFFAEHYECCGEEFDYSVFKFVEPEIDKNGKTEIEDGYFSNPKEMYWVVVVLSEGEVFDVLRMNRAEHLSAIPDTSRIVKEVDVNFDGSKEIVLWTGHYGSRGVVTYECYLYMNNELVRCDSFANIPNPKVDMEKQVIYSDSIAGGASRGWVVYRYISDSFVPIERLTIGIVDAEDFITSHSNTKKRDAFCWTIETFINNEWQITNYFTENDDNADIRYDEKIRNKDAFWSIIDEGGKLLELSIYKND